MTIPKSDQLQSKCNTNHIPKAGRKSRPHSTNREHALQDYSSLTLRCSPITEAILTNNRSNLAVAFKQRYLEDEDVDSIASPSVSGRSDNKDASEIQKDNEELRYDAVFGLSYQCVILASPT